MSHPSVVQAGDTIWIRGGIYRVVGDLKTRLVGSPGRPIVVRAYPGERVTLDVGSSVENRIHIQGHYTWYWGLEVMSSENGDSSRWGSPSQGGPPNRGRGIDVGGAGYTRGIKLINCVIHDVAGNGIGAWGPATAFEAYGNIVYNNGYLWTDRGHGHAFYLQNDSTIKYIRDNIMFWSYDINLQAYTENLEIDSTWLEGNISFNSRWITGDSVSKEYATNYYIGSRANYSVFIENFMFNGTLATYATHTIMCSSQDFI